MSRLKPVAEAGINPLTGTAYTYTATADNWVSIGKETRPFQGQYNGNGYTISNLKSGDCGCLAMQRTPVSPVSTCGMST